MDEPLFPVNDIQAFVATGFGSLRHGEYLLLSMVDRAATQAWLRALLQTGLVMGAHDVGQQAGAARRETVALAFSHAGLLALGARPSAQYPFPAVFSDGMAAPDHAQLLGDGSAAHWRWSDVDQDERKAAHLLVVHLADNVTALSPESSGCLGDAALARAFGPHVQRIAAPASYFDEDGRAHEPFGFRDGVSQPEPIGLNGRLERGYAHAQLAERRARDQHRVAPGEFVLGLRNEYDDLSHAPDLLGWQGAGRFANHASYLAVRQIRQDVQAFEAFRSDWTDARDGAWPAASLAERMMGRRQDGAPLCAHDPAFPNAFGFRAEDPQGFDCPRGSHARRAHPRDSLGFDAETGRRVSRLHRLLRRARSYEKVGPDGSKAEQGSFFIALNADIERQFAFVQQRWIANPRFADLSNETDPLLGAQARNFTLPDPVMGQRVINLPRFTELVGGGYFLLPGLQALHFLANLGTEGDPPPAAGGPVQGIEDR